MPPIKRHFRELPTLLAQGLYRHLFDLLKTLAKIKARVNSEFYEKHKF